LITPGSERRFKVVTPKKIKKTANTTEKNAPRRVKCKSIISKHAITSYKNQDSSENQPKQLFQPPRNSARIKANESKKTTKTEGLQIFIKKNKAVPLISPQKLSKGADPDNPLPQLKPTPLKDISVRESAQIQHPVTSVGFATDSSPNCYIRMSPTPIPELLLGKNKSVARKLNFDQPPIKTESKIHGLEASTSSLGSVLFPSSLMSHGLEKSFVPPSSMLENNARTKNFFSSHVLNENHVFTLQNLDASQEMFQPLPAEADRLLTFMPPHLSSFFSSGMISLTSASNHSELAADEWDLPSVGGDIMDQHWTAGQSWNGHFRVSPETNPAAARGVNQVLPKPRLEPMDSLFLDDDLFVVEDLNHLDVKEARENLVETPTMFK
jgi:hypothetical protein